MMDVTRMMQNGTWSGWVEVDGVRHEFSPEHFRAQETDRGACALWDYPMLNPTRRPQVSVFLDLGTDEL